MLQKTTISGSDLVLEIGSGTGVITEQLCRIAHTVVAVEKDANLSKIAEKKLKSCHLSNCSITACDFLEYRLPTEQYKVFSNIPFNYTADIVRKLLFAKNSPEDAYLLMQKEAAERFAGQPEQTMIAVQIAPLYSIKFLHRFRRTDFQPEPGVDIVFVHFRKRHPRLVHNYEIYRDFVQYSYLSNKSNIRSAWRNIFSYTQLKRLGRRYSFDINSPVRGLSDAQWIEVFAYLQEGVEPSKIRHLCSFAKQSHIKRKRINKNFRTICRKK